MSLMGAGSVYEVRLFTQSQDGTQIGINVLHYETLSITGIGADDNLLRAVMTTAFAAKMKALLWNGASYLGLGTRRVLPLPIGVEVYTATGAGVGTGGAPPLPSQVAGMIQKRTLKAGRHGHGRVYLPFPSATDSSATGHPTAGYITKLAAFALEMEVSRTVGTAPDTSLVIPVIWDRVGKVATEITDCIDQPRWATQRRRGDYGRHNLPPF